MDPNKPVTPKEVVQLPKNQNKSKIANGIMAEEVYIQAKTFRIQVYILIEFSRDYYEGIYKLTYQDVADMFDVTVPIIKRAYINAKKDLDEKSRPNGRPFSLSKEQVQRLSEWMKSQQQPPHIKQVKSFIANEVGEDLDNKTYKNALNKAGLKTEESEAIDADRYYCNPSSIENYYDLLESYFLTYDIPSPFVFNVDEEGHDEYVDTKKTELVVVPKSNTQKLRFPVERKDDHTTFVACICADGSFMKPLIVVKRKTIEARIMRTSLWNKLRIEHDETGYINSKIFDIWTEKIFIPEVNRRRLEFNYTGPAVLILDGCPSHYTEKLFDLCNANTIKIFFIPPHSSNQTQMLDLATFHSHKENVRSARLFDITNDDLLVDKIQMLYDSFQKAASYKTIISSFEAAGAVFEPNGCMPIVRFSIDFTTQIWHKNKTKKEKAEIKEKRKGKGKTETRIDVEDYGNLSVYWSNKDAQKVVKKMPKIIDYTNCTDPFHRLLLAFVPLDKSDFEFMRDPQNQSLNKKEEIKKGRPKKEEKEEKVDDLYIICSFNEKLNFELESLGLNE